MRRLEKKYQIHLSGDGELGPFMGEECSVVSGIGKVIGGRKR